MNNNRSLNENNPFNSIDENDPDEIDFSSDSRDKLNESITYVFNSDNTELKFKFDLPIGKTENITTKKKYIFKTKLQKMKRGRIAKKNTNKETHSAYSYDNILRKIQVHYLNFMISFINDCIKTLNQNKKIRFKKINYKLKRKISKEFFDNMKNSSINDILKNIDISKKYKKFDKNINKENLRKLEKDPWFEKLFKMNFLDLFTYYYNQAQPLDELFLFEKTITFSDETKPYYKLLEANWPVSKNFIEITEMNYIKDENINQQETNNTINNFDDIKSFN